MTDLPEPLTPADCNLRGLPFMPMMVSQVMQSETYALSSGDEFKAAFTLWFASWLEVPAASLPNDDRMLEFLSRAKAWKKVKAMALRGWVLCSDGRLYHPVVAARAMEAWDRRTVFRDKEDGKNERQRRWREQCKQLAAQLHDLGITPPKGASLETLRCLLEAQGVDAQSSTDVDVSPSTVDAGEMPKRETVKGERELTSKPDTSSQASTGVGEPEHPGETIPTARNVQIALMLRAQGVQATAQHPIVCLTWAGDPLVTDDVLNLAIAKSKAAKPNESIPVKYLQRVVEGVLADQAAPPPEPAAAKPRDDWAWKKSREGIDAKGRELGMFARGSEQYPDFAERIQREIDKRKGRQP